MCQKELRTTSPGNSIWLNLPEENFRQNLVKLEERTNAVPIGPESHNAHTLPLVVEQQVADDFASLVAVEEGAQSVAAVCIEEHPPGLQASRLTLRFAALDVSLNDAIKNPLQEWSTILSGVASGDLSRLYESFPDPVDELFHGIIQLHFRRLLARLRSCKWDKPLYLSKSHKKPLWQDLAGVIHRVQFAYTKKEKATRTQVEKMLNELTAAFKTFEVTSGDGLIEMEHVVKNGFEFSSSPIIKDYLHRLEDSVGDKPTPQIASAIKTIRQIQKIASYRRISIFLVKIAKQYPQLFNHGITLAYLTPYKSIPTTIGYEEWATTCHVHAEVQLAVHYDLISTQEREAFLTPRAIGISKSLCYLCYRFLRAHGGFFPSRTHGRLYDQWTLPDLAEMNDALVKRYRGIVKDIDDEVVRHTAEEPEMWRIEPMTSVDVYLHQM